MKDQVSIKDLKNLNDYEVREINGGEPGDAAYWIGRTYVYTTAHLLTGGLATIYLIFNKTLN